MSHATKRSSVAACAERAGVRATTSRRAKNFFSEEKQTPEETQTLSGDADAPLERLHCRWIAAVRAQPAGGCAERAGAFGLQRLDVQTIVSEEKQTLLRRRRPFSGDADAPLERLHRRWIAAVRAQPAGGCAERAGAFGLQRLDVQTIVSEEKQ